MATIDDPKEWILVLFKREIHESGMRRSKVYPNGISFNALPTEPGEKIYGVHNGKYYFSPIALYIIDKQPSFSLFRKPVDVRRIVWKTIIECTSIYTAQPKTSRLTLSDNSVETIQLSELQNENGYDGRIGQLYHQMIEQHGSLYPRQFPTPTHLEKISTTLPSNKQNHAMAVWTGNIICSCSNNKQFEVYVNDFLLHKIIPNGSDQEHQQCSVKCVECHEKFEIFDSSKHGYNASIQENKNHHSSILNFEKVLCSCGNKTHDVNCAAIYDFDDIKNLVDTKPSNEFGAFSVDLICCACGKKSTIIEYETA